jgi:hypothetical protein
MELNAVLGPYDSYCTVAFTNNYRCKMLCQSITSFLKQRVENLSKVGDVKKKQVKLQN